MFDNCGWKKCPESSTIIYYGVAGLCDKHSAEWLTKKEAFQGVDKASKKLLNSYCSEEAKQQYKKANETES